MPDPLDRPHVALPRDPGSAAPALLLLHGTGGDEHDLLGLRDLLAPGAPVLAPRGTVLEQGMPRFFRRLQEGVFDEEDLSTRADELAGFVTAASARYGLAARTLVAVGFSNGANIASALLLRHPGLLRGAALFAAMVPYAEPPGVQLADLPVLVANGARDPMIPRQRTELLQQQLRDRGAVVTDVPHPGGHQLEAGALRRTAGWLASLPER